MNDNEKNLLVIISSMIPTIGGTLSFILDKYLPSETEKRRIEFLTQIERDITQLKKQVDLRRMETPEFQAIFSRLLKSVVEEHRKEKIDAFRNITVKLITNPYNLDFNKIDFYARLALILIPDELKLLHLFYQMDVKKLFKEYDTDIKRRDFISIVDQLWGEIDREYLMALITDCSRYQLISASSAQQKRYQREGLFLTTLGEEFLEYIYEPVREETDEKK